MIRNRHRYRTKLHLHRRPQRMQPNYCLLTKPLWSYLRTHR